MLDFTGKLTGLYRAGFEERKQDGARIGKYEGKKKERAESEKRRKGWVEKEERKRRGKVNRSHAF